MGRKYSRSSGKLNEKEDVFIIINGPPLEKRALRQRLENPLFSPARPRGLYIDKRQSPGNEAKSKDKKL